MTRVSVADLLRNVKPRCQRQVLKSLRAFLRQVGHLEGRTQGNAQGMAVADGSSARRATTEMTPVFLIRKPPDRQAETPVHMGTEKLSS